jgi:hypothetical protein
LDPLVTHRDLEVVIRHYRANYQAVPMRELDYFATRESDEDAVGEAAMCSMGGKRLSHQQRRSRSTLEEARRRLLANLPLLRSATTFEQLHDDVEVIIGSIHDIGALTVYDIALRIGARFDLSPERVYLHSGTRDGARVLGLAWRSESLAMTELPEPLQALAAREVEDVLCIYKNDFASGEIGALRRGVRAGRGCC